MNQLAFARLLVESPKDDGLRLAYADFLEETGCDCESALQRWLAYANETGILYGDACDPEEPFSWCVHVDMEQVPEVVVDGLPRSMVGGDNDAPGNMRILDDLWVSRLDAEVDLGLAWRKAWESPLGRIVLQAAAEAVNV